MDWFYSLPTALHLSLHLRINTKDKCFKFIALTCTLEELNSSCGQAFEDHKMAGCNSCGKHSKVLYFIGYWRRLRKNRTFYSSWMTILKASCLQKAHFILTTLCSPPYLMSVVKHNYTIGELHSKFKTQQSAPIRNKFQKNELSKEAALA